MARPQDPMTTHCPACGHTGRVPVAELRSLRAVCPVCGASLAAAGEWLNAESDKMGRVGELVALGYELTERYGLTDDGLLAGKSLDELVRAFAEHPGVPAADRARADAIVTDAARRLAPRLLSEVGPAASV